MIKTRGVKVLSYQWFAVKKLNILRLRKNLLNRNNKRNITIFS